MTKTGDGAAAKPVVAFLGLGIMGTAMAARLVASGHYSKVVVWNRSADKCAPLVAAGAAAVGTPAEAVEAADVVFGMLADPKAALNVALGEGGVVSAMRAGKAYVDMSTVDEETSTRIGEAVAAAGGRFLEAPVSGSKKPAIDGQLIILAAGDESLFDECGPAFDTMGKRALFLGPLGAGARMKLVVNGVMGAVMGAFSEGMALAEASGLRQSDLLEVLSLGAMACPMFALKGPALAQRSYPPAFKLVSQQKDMRLALALGDALDQPLPVMAAANEQYKKAKALGLGDSDFSAVYEAYGHEKKA
ncbi:glyoxylate succinic semialdehyde reductase-like [Raphidocelis subcapitata]|uniref:Glyoxylate succinic semialdehyde reductase-like n=1 Tax=Raphidocelis subcapitata TaxID=307507 RepID=A0A2V0NVK2_9CHLO|nr:glyoxylate succinic semialdehyde reductase-like [Raphidocelis subcapitata]|eukprot:GBF88845.1 glyoxylate succinic semialdehyde reductase-like [Raphidocelis subcapitata]